MNTPTTKKIKKGTLVSLANLPYIFVVGDLGFEKKAKSSSFCEKHPRKSFSVVAEREVEENGHDIPLFLARALDQPQG